MFNISTVEEKDLARIIELSLELNRSPYNVDPQFIALIDEPKPPISIIQQIAIPNSHITTFVARLNDYVIGFISFAKEHGISNALTKQDPNSPQCGTILFLSVDPKYRRQNIATSLIKACITQFKREQVSIIRIGTDYGNIAALLLYQKLGFKNIMNWHIYRIYQHELVPTLSYQTIRGLTPAPTWAEPLNSVILRRPIPWFYTPELNSSYVHRYVLESLHENLKNNQQIIVQKVLYNKIVGLSLKQEIDKEKYYQLKGTLWKIDDLLESGVRGELLPQFVKYFLSQLPSFLMAEMWVNASDYESQRIADQIGMKFVYGGHVLTLNMSNTNK